MVDTIKFSEFTDGGDLQNNDITVGLDGSNAKFNNPWTFLRSGTTGDRPAPSADMYYRLRLNTTLESYEYYSPTTMDWVQLEDSIDVQSFPFVIYTDEPLLPNSFNLGSLANGILKQTVITGVATPEIAEVDTDYYGPGMTGYMQYPAGIKDSNGNIIVKFNSTVGADSWITLVNNLATLGPIMMSDGPANDIGLVIQGKGEGGVGFKTSNTTVPFNFYSGTNSQHTTNFSMANTAENRTVTWQDSDGTVAWITDIPDVSTTPIALACAQWDTNLNLSANNTINGLTSIATAGGNTVLTVASPYTIQYTGTLNQTVTAPVVSTLQLGQSYKIINDSTGTLTINSSGGNAIVSVVPFSQVIITCRLLTGTTEASWTYTNTLNAAGLGTVSVGVTFATPGDLSVVYTNNTLSFMRVGNMVFFSLFLNFTPTYTTASGTFSITGFPFSVNSSTQICLTSLTTQSVIFPSDYIDLIMVNGTTTANILTTTSNAGNNLLGVGGFPSGTAFQIRASGFYFV